MSSTNTTPSVAEAVDHQLVVDDLVVAVHRRLEGPDHPGQRLDGHLDAGAEAPGRGEQHLVDGHASGHGVPGARARILGPCPLPRVVAVAPGSPADAGRAARRATRSCAIDGRAPRDVIEWQLLADEADLELEVRRGGLDLTVAVRQGGGRAARRRGALGAVRPGAHVRQPLRVLLHLPAAAGPAASLYLKDDDYRLSFLYGNFTTLTRFTEADLERVVTEGLSARSTSASTPPTPTCGPACCATAGAPPACAGCGPCSTTASRCTARSWCARASTTAPCSTTRWPACSTEYPELAVAVRRAARRQPLLHRAGACAPTPRPRRRRSSTLVEDWQAIVPPRARPPARVRRRRVLPAGRPAVPAGRGLRGLPHARGRRRHGPHLRGRVHRARRRAPPGHGRASSPGSTARPAEGYRAPRTAPRRRSRSRPRRRRAGRRPHRRRTAPGCSSRWWPGSAATTCGWSRSRTRSSAATSASPACWWARTSPACWPTSPRATATCCPTSACPGPLPRRHHARRPAPAGRGRPHRRRRPAPGAGALTMSALPVVAVVGRPNVGKSTLVNRIVGRREAIVEEQPGVTRDRKEVEAEWNGRRFTVVDTGGWLAQRRRARRQGEPAGRAGVAEADVVLFVVDATVGVTEEDARVAAASCGGRTRRCSSSPTRSTPTRREADAWEFMQLGLGDPLAGQRPARPAHRRPARRGRRRLPPGRRAPSREPRRSRRRAPDVPARRHRRPAQRGQVDAVQPADRRRAVGRARHAGHDPRHHRHRRRDRRRARSASSTPPGMRRKARIDEGTEYYSLVRALQAVDEADVALLVIDATEGVTHQDQRLAERVDAAGCPVVVLLNKWELLDAEARPTCVAQVGRPAALPRRGAGAEGQRRSPARACTGCCRRSAEAIERLPPAGADPGAQPGAPGGPGRAAGAHAAGCSTPRRARPTRPRSPCSPTATCPPTYLRYLERRIREHFEFGTTPLKLRVRRRSG